MINNTRDKIEQILNIRSGLLEENHFIDYKSGKIQFTNKGKCKIKKLILSFVNSIQSFYFDKYILFGIDEDKKTKKKIIVGLEYYDFPDDNEWQNLLDDVKPFRPIIETGTLEHKGLKLGYIFISSNNYNVPYFFIDKKEEVYFIRNGSKQDPMKEAEKKELLKRKEDLESKGRIYPKSDAIILLTILGKYNENNKFDITLIENSLDKKYDDIKLECLGIDNSFTQNKPSIYRINDYENVVFVQDKNSRLLQFSSDEMSNTKNIIIDILKNENESYSKELLEGVADTLCFMTNNGFSYLSNSIIESVITIESFQHHKYSNIFCQIAESSPNLLLRLISENKTEILKLNYNNRTLIDVIRVIAWFPEYFIEATKLLIEFKCSSIYNLFQPVELETAASYEQKLGLINEIIKLNKDLAFDILNDVLYFNPNITRVSNRFYIPDKYRRLFYNIHDVDFRKFQEYYNILVKCVGNNTDKLLKLLPMWLIPFPFSNLYLLADYIEKVEPLIESEDERQKIWNRLSNQPLIYNTKNQVDDNLKDRLITVGNKFKPKDKYRQYQQLFSTNSHIQTEVSLDEQKKNILLEIYSENGIDRLIEFISTIKVHMYILANILLSSEFTLTIDDDNALITAFLKDPIVYSNYFYKKSYREGLEWIKKLNTNDLCIENRVCLFSELNASIENINYFENVLGKEIKLYWENFGTKGENALDIQYCFEQLIYFNMPKKAFDLLSQSPINILCPQWLFNALMKQDEYEKLYIRIYNFADIYHFLVGKLEDNKLKQIEELSFRLYSLEFDELKPHVTFKTIVNDPEIFVKTAKCAIDNQSSLQNHLLLYCDQKPNYPIIWVDQINKLILNEDEEKKIKVEEWLGYIFYNFIRNDSDKHFEIDDIIAGLLEKSKPQRDGFFKHGFIPNRKHIKGDYNIDANERKNAKNFSKLAEIQEKKGNIEFSKTLQDLANRLIERVNL